MTQKHDTSATDPKTAEDVAAPNNRVIKGFLWLFLAGAVIGGGIWAVQNNLIDSYKNQPEQDEAQPVAHQPDAPVIPTPTLTPSALQTADIADLQARLEQAKRVRLALRKDINTLEAQLAVVTQRLDAMQSTLETLQSGTIAGTAPAGAEPSPATSSMQAELAALNEKIATLQQDYETKNQRYITRLQINQLLDSIAVRLREGESYAADMRQLMLLSADSGLSKEALEKLSAYADDGAPSLAKLIDMFDVAVQDAIPASLNTKENPSFSDEMRGHLSRVVTIRRIEADATDDSDEAQIARAETELQMGNVDMALTHLEQLPDTPREVFSPWMSEAEAYLAARDAMAQLKNALMQTSAE